MMVEAETIVIVIGNTEAFEYRESFRWWVSQDARNQRGGSKDNRNCLTHPTSRRLQY
jgi:hypothetical protein